MCEPGSAEWWASRQENMGRRPRPRADGLTLERVLDAALDIVDAEGLAGLTMRRLAAALDCGHASLYRHVAGHQEIVVLLADRVLGTISLDQPAEGSTRDRAEQALRRYRDALLEHPSLVPAFLSGQLLGPNALARREEGLRLLLDAGAPPQLAAQAYLSLTHFVIASAAFESSGAAHTPAERKAMRGYFDALPTETYPTVTGLSRELNEVDPTDEFEFGMHALLDHIAAVGAAFP